MQGNLSTGCANSPRSLISAFVIRLWYHILTRYERNFNFLASLCSWGDWFKSDFVGNPEDKFLLRRGHCNVCTAVVGILTFMNKGRKISCLRKCLNTCNGW